MNLTQEFKSSPRAYIDHIAARIAGRLWWLLSIAAAIIFIGIFIDLRWALAGLMILFFVYPMIMSVVILRYASLPTVVHRATANLLRFAPDHSIIILKIHHLDDDTTRTDEIERANIVSTEFRKDTIVVHTGKALTDFLIIPRSALSEGQLQLLSTKQPVYTDS